jgi:hypothetical protein
MTGDKDVRRRLLAFLDGALFNPVLELTREDFHGLDDKHRFDDIKRKVADERRRYHDHCPEAADIKESFLRDLESRTSRRLNENLRDLGLPTYWDIREEFLRLCGTYGV